MAHDRPVISPKDLLVRRFEEVRSLIETPSALTAMDCADVASKVAQLIADKACLMDAANTDKIKVRFHARQASRLPNGLHYAVRMTMDGMDRGDAPGKQAWTKDQLLGLRVIYAGDTPITVRDVIRYVRNVEGGTHYDPGELSGEWKVLQALSHEIETKGLPTGHVAVIPIARVVLAGLAPLYAACKAERGL